MFNFCNTIDSNRHQTKSDKNILRENSQDNLILQQEEDCVSEQEEYFIEGSIFFTDEEIDYKIFEEKLKTTKKLEQDISNINDMVKTLNEEIIKDGENLESISRNIESSQRNVEITNKSLENIVILQDNKKKIIMGGFGYYNMKLYIYPNRYNNRFKNWYNINCFWTIIKWYFWKSYWILYLNEKKKKNFCLNIRLFC